MSRMRLVRRLGGRGGALMLGLALIAGCGQEQTPPDLGPSELEARASEPDAPESAPIDPAETGRVAGVVRFRGEPPVQREIPLIRECRVHDEPQRAEVVVVGPDRGLRDVLVHVRRGLAGWQVPPADASQSLLLDQIGCRYVPHVVALRAGQTLRVANSDPLTHNVRVSAPRNNLDANRSQARGGAEIELAFHRTEIGARVACDLHPWMGAVIHALDHPFFVVTAEDGAFEIDGLPPGEFELEAWHPTLGKSRSTVTVTSGAVTPLEFEFQIE